MADRLICTRLLPCGSAIVPSCVVCTCYPGSQPRAQMSAADTGSVCRCHKWVLSPMRSPCWVLWPTSTGVRRCAGVAAQHRHHSSVPLVALRRFHCYPRRGPHSLSLYYSINSLYIASIAFLSETHSYSSYVPLYVPVTVTCSLALTGKHDLGRPPHLRVCV